MEDVEITTFENIPEEVINSLNTLDPFHSNYFLHNCNYAIIPNSLLKFLPT